MALGVVTAPGEADVSTVLMVLAVLIVLAVLELTGAEWFA